MVQSVSYIWPAVYYNVHHDLTRLASSSSSFFSWKASRNFNTSAFNFNESTTKMTRPSSPTSYLMCSSLGYATFSSNLSKKASTSSKVWMPSSILSSISPSGASLALTTTMARKGLSKPSDPSSTVSVGGVFSRSDMGTVNTSSSENRCSVAGAMRPKPLHFVKVCTFNNHLQLVTESLAPCLESVDQLVGGLVVGGHVAGVVQLLADDLGQDLTQLNTPLVEGVDVPNGTLDEGHVLVVGDQGTQSSWGDLSGQDRRGRSVTAEDLVGDQASGGTLLLDLLLVLTDHQGFSLSKEVGGQHSSVQVVLDRVVGLGGEDEVGGDELGTSVHQLEERVSGVGGWLTEQDGAGSVVGEVVASGDRLTVGLHGQLSQVSRETVQVSVEWSDQVGSGTKEVVVPHGQQTTGDGDVLLQWGGGEVVVKGLGTLQEGLEVLVTNVDGHRQANGGPHRVTTTDPALEAEHVLGVDTELAHLLSVGGQCGEVLGDVGILLSGLQEPQLGRVGVGAGLGGGEGLGSNQEQGGLSVQALQGLGQVSSVDVGHEVGVEAWLRVSLQGLGDHDRAQVGTTNTNVDHVGDSLAGVTGPGTGSDGVGKLLHVLEHGVDLAGGVLAVHGHWLHGAVSQGNVVHGSVLSLVDLGTGKHLVSQLLDASLAGQLHQLGLDGVIDDVLGEVEQDLGAVEVGEGVGELGESSLVGGKLVLDFQGLAHGLVRGLEFFPGGQFRSLVEGGVFGHGWRKSGENRDLI